MYSRCVRKVQQEYTECTAGVQLYRCTEGTVPAGVQQVYSTSAYGLRYLTVPSIYICYLRPAGYGTLRYLIDKTKTGRIRYLTVP